MISLHKLLTFPVCLATCVAFAEAELPKPILDYECLIKEGVLTDSGLDSNHGRTHDVDLAQEGARGAVLVFNGKSSRVETLRSVNGKAIEIYFQPEKGLENQIIFQAAKRWSGQWPNQRTMLGIDPDGYLTVVVGFGSESGQEPAVLKLKTPVVFGNWNHVLVSLESDSVVVRLNENPADRLPLSLPPCEADLFNIGCIHDNYIDSLIARSKAGDPTATTELAGVLKGRGVSPDKEEEASISAFYKGKIGVFRVWEKPLSDAAADELSSTFSKWRDK